MKRSKQDRAVAKINHHAYSKANASKKVSYTKQPSYIVTQGNKIHILESQKTSSKPPIINTHQASSLNIDYTHKDPQGTHLEVKKIEIDHTIKREILDKALPYSASTVASVVKFRGGNVHCYILSKV